MKETNMEHYRSEIETACHGIKLKNGEIYMCHGAAKCSDCEFRDMYAGLGCQRAIVRWLMSPYKPELVLTAREKHFVEFAQEGWLARDSCGELWWHKAKPEKGENCWRNGNVTYSFSGILVFDQHFRFITWEDEEPWAVEDLRKLIVKGGEADETD